MNGNGNIYLTMFVYLLIIALLIGGMLFVRKYLMKRLGGLKSGVYMKVIDRLVISQDKQILLIETKSKIIVVGVTQQRMENLSEFSKDELEALDPGEKIDGNGTGGNSNFWGILSEKFRNNGKDEK